MKCYTQNYLNDLYNFQNCVLKTVISNSFCPYTALPPFANIASTGVNAKKIFTLSNWLLEGLPSPTVTCAVRSGSHVCVLWLLFFWSGLFRSNSHFHESFETLRVWFYAMVHSYVLQDIYDLKDQIQDVEGRYMQGLKELKVSGPSLQPKHALCAQKCQ